MEETKSDLKQFSEATTKRREVYVEIVKSAGVFISRDVDEEKVKEMKSKFLIDYSTLWLWASDEVIKAINHLLELSSNKDKNKPETASQEDLKKAYSTFVFEMRKDAGNHDSKLGIESYKFIKF